LRLWFEKRELPDAAPEWRGVIEHIESGKKKYFRYLTELTPYLQEYLESGDTLGERSE